MQKFKFWDPCSHRLIRFGCLRYPGSCGTDRSPRTSNRSPRTGNHSPRDCSVRCSNNRPRSSN